MLEFEPQYPRIALAVRLLAEDAGDGHAERLGRAPAGSLVARRIRAAADGASAGELEDVETYLAGLSREDLETLCIGEQDDRLALDAPAIVLELLHRAFEGLGHA